MDIAIINGTVVDGTGAPCMRADVGITDDRIVAVGELSERAGRTVDAAGRIVAPGFIDAHAHSDFALLRDPLNPEKVMQGVTTNIIGNCALSPAPVNDTVRLFFEGLLQHVLGTVKIRWTWRTAPPTPEKCFRCKRSSPQRWRPVPSASLPASCIRRAASQTARS
jgi:N-acyl-D-amino-acid deacylase